jgi:thioredoxin 1
MIRLINKHKWPLMIFAVVLIVTVGCNGSHKETNPLELALANGKPTLVEFGQGICIPCKEMRPILEGLALDHKDKLNVVIIDINEFPVLTDEYGVMAIPAQIVFDSNGNKVFSHLGFWPKEDILAQLKTLGIS